MKKLLTISLATLLLVSTIGVTVHKHYCENKLVATSLLPHFDGDACDTDMPMEDGACSDEHEQFDIDSPIVITASSIEMTPLFEWVAASFFTIITTQTELNFTPKFYADASPPPSEPNIYTKVQSFLL